MTNAELAQCRKRLEQFLTDLVEPLGRSERRHWADVYVRGLLWKRQVEHGEVSSGSWW